ncbi:MAG TPA: AAA family ATPase [Aldersonia sp.]
MGSGWPLTGRAEELQAITGCVDTSGAAGIVLAGAAGVGKTRLARETLTRGGQRGRSCRFVAATTSARSVPLGAFADYADRLGPDPLARISDVVDAVTETPRGCPPVVVGVDDAHLLDEQSALVVHQIVRRHLASVVLTIRTGESAPDAITALWKDELLPRLEVQPLSKAETAALLETVLAGDVESASAQRVWYYTRGNALYLRQLIADELAAGRFMQQAGVWIWDTNLRVSPTLADLIDATIGRQPGPVLAVLDVLTVADPLELNVRAAVADPTAVNQAENAGLITVDTAADPPVARLAHPMFGESRRTRGGTMRLRSLRSTVAASLGTLDPDPIQLVRRAVLLVDSDSAPDPNLLMNAARAARQLMDPITAERLARRAVENGGGETAQRIHMGALVNCDRLGEALAVNADLIETASTNHDRVFLTLIRAAIFLKYSATGDAEPLLGAIRELVAETGLRRPYHCVVALLEFQRSRPHAAVEAATAGLTEPGWLHESFESVGDDRLRRRLRRARTPRRDPTARRTRLRPRTNRAGNADGTLRSRDSAPRRSSSGRAAHRGNGTGRSAGPRADGLPLCPHASGVVLRSDGESAWGSRIGRALVAGSACDGSAPGDSVAALGRQIALGDGSGDVG